MSDSEISCKKQRLCEVSLASPPKLKPDSQKSVKKTSKKSDIFKLDADCLDEIFDYLSLKDLHSFGQSCKTMQRVAGEYFARNYFAAEKFIGKDGIYTIYSDDNGVINKRIRTSCFNEFTQFISHHYEEFEPFRYIESHSNEFAAVNHLYLVCVGLNAAKMKYFQNLLPQIKVAQIRQCTIWNGEFYEILLKSCQQLQRLYIQDDLGDIINRKKEENVWLQQKYPSLTHLELTPRYSFEISQLSKFFAVNPNVRSFSTNSHCLWANRQQFIESSTKLDFLEIKHFDAGFYFYHVDRLDIRSICTLLNRLHEQGFYKRLHLYVKCVDKDSCEHLATLKGLEKLSIRSINGNGQALACLNQLKELNIFDCSNATHLNDVAKNLVKLERLLIQNASYEDILPFIRFSVKLRQMKILPKCEEEFNGGVVGLHALNNDREKLPGARRTVIYIEDNIFLHTKWNIKDGETNLNMLEMRRANSLCWDYDYATVKILH